MVSISFSRKAIVFIVGISMIAVFFILNFIISNVLSPHLEINLAAGIPYILVAGILLIVSAFLPTTFAKVFRNISYLVLFICILIVEIQLIKPFVQVSQVNVEQCKSLFFPEVKEGVSNVIINALGITSCILTGYFPQEQSILGWLTFLLFYIILPFAFIFALIVSLMRDVLKDIFGNKIIVVISFVVAAYATRVFFGAFLLQFLGYSAWGLAGIFGAIFIVGSVRKLIEGWFKLETYAEEIKKYYEVEKTNKQKYAEFALEMLKELKNRIPDKIEDATKKRIIDQDIIKAAYRLRDIPFFESLNKEEKDVIEDAIDEITKNVVAGYYNEVKKVLEGLEEVLKNWKK